MDKITYKGIDYPIRTFDVKIDDRTRRITIAQESLCEAFGEVTATSEPWDDEAEDTDAMIYYYIPDQFWNLPDAEIARYHLDQTFELASDEDDKEETFEFNIDQKQISWERKTYRIKADSYEEAKTKAIAVYNGEDDTQYDDIDSIGNIIDMDPKGNRGYSTRILQDANEEQIISNGKSGGE